MVPSLLLQSCELPMSAEKNPGRKIKLRKSKFQIRKLKFPKSSFSSRIYFINFSTNRKKLSSVKAHLSQRNEIYKIVFQYIFLFKVRNISTPTRQNVQPLRMFKKPFTIFCTTGSYKIDIQNCSRKCLIANSLYNFRNSLYIIMDGSIFVD